VVPSKKSTDFAASKWYKFFLHIGEHCNVKVKLELQRSDKTSDIFLTEIK